MTFHLPATGPQDNPTDPVSSLFCEVVEGLAVPTEPFCGEKVAQISLTPKRRNRQEFPRGDDVGVEWSHGYTLELSQDTS
jgi:hypothetical protein